MNPNNYFQKSQVMSMQTTEKMNMVFEYINLDYLDMMADGDNEMKKVMLGMLFEEMPLELEKMQQLCNDSKWQELSGACHKMKSTLSFVGNDTMTNTNKTLEIMSQEETETESFPAMINTLMEMWPKVKVELQGVHDGL